MNEIYFKKTETNEKEILEMIIQFLYENKYLDSAKQLEAIAGIVYDQHEIQQLNILIKSHNFEEAIKFVEKSNFENSKKDEVLKFIRIRKFIEYITNGLVLEGLEYLRKELSGLIKDKSLLNKFSILLFQKDKENLDRLLKQYFNEIRNDDILINKIQSMLCLSLDSHGNRILPNSRLETLLNTYVDMNLMDVDEEEEEGELKGNGNKLSSLTNIFIIDKHEDEIWHLELSCSYRYFATCSRNGMVCTFRIDYNEDLVQITCLSCFLAHKKYVTAMDWSKDELHLLTASSDKLIKLWNPLDGKCLKTFTLHSDIVTTIKWLNDDTFVSGGIDKLLTICTMDNRVLVSETFSRIRKVLICDLLGCLIVIPSSMNDIILYDYKNYKEIHRITELDPIISANISQADKGRYLIVNFSKVNAYINLYDLTNFKLVNKFYGHIQEQYVVECFFAGPNDEYIICGSEDCNIYIWERSNSIPTYTIKGHTGCINSCRLIYNNGIPYIISASDDYTIRLWHDKNIEIVYKDRTKKNGNRKLSDLYRENLYNINGNSILTEQFLDSGFMDSNEEEENEIDSAAENNSN
jgi:WD40 repeat protein